MEPRPIRAWLALGSNAGPSRKRLNAALSAIALLPGTRVTGVSKLYRSSPVGRLPQPDFLNCAAAVVTRLSPMGLLTECKRLEAEAGRKPGARWGPRPLDIDIILYGRRRVRTPFLSIPHPEALGRRFVLAPLADVAGPVNWPGRRLTVRRALERLKAPSQNVNLIASSPRR